MFEFKQGISESDALNKLKASRNTESEQSVPTEEPEVVNVSEDAPVEEVVETGAQANDQEISETEESAEEEVVETTTQDEGEDLYVEYKGREINLKDIEEWEQGHLRQADYTRKSQANAEERKQLDSDRQKLDAEKAKFSERLATLDAIIKQDTKTSEEIAELKEYEPEEYIKYIERQQERQKLLDESKVDTTPKGIDAEAESKKLFDAHPEWVDASGQQTEKFKEDMALMNKYAQSVGYTDADIPHLTARDYNVILDAARYRDASNKSAVIEKKVRKAPVTTKPKAAVKTGLTDEIKKLDKLVRTKGRPEDFVKLRKLKRQLNN